MIKGVHHIQITIPRNAEQEGKAFYCGVLGLTEIEKPNALKKRGGFWLRVGDREVHVSTEVGAERLKTKAHIAYLVDDVNYWRKELHEMNISTGESIPIPGYDRFECRDPFGNRMEFIQEI
ncbi:VOC family protein [Shouchella patagoniensis]|uniref:VOC family protein n=1 Tax=Shouchella patagoniensis TaxID=228576 RepID=UPI000994D3AF|nr:VOC family protein [Shouchella patagoniensis]